jgi:hypothetical protein
MAAIQQVLMAVGTSISLPANLIANVTAESYNNQTSSASVSLDFLTNGTLSLEYNAQGTLQDPAFAQFEQYTWLVGGTSSLFSVRMRRTSGAFSPGSAAVDTWLPITSDLFWYLLSNSNSFTPSNGRSFTGVLELAYTNNLTNILAQSNINFSTFALTQGGDIR